MLPYFPFDAATFALAMGTRPLPLSGIIEIDAAEVNGELRLKDQLLATDPTEYCRLGSETLAAQWDALGVLLPGMAARYPQWFRLARAGDDWQWHNGLRHTTTRLRFGDAAALPQPPLEWLARQVQEDLLLLAPDAERGFPLVGGVLCFPNMWGIGQKLGQPISTIHETVPEFAERLGHSMALLMARLKVGHPVWRLNWSLLPLEQLNLSPRYFAENAAAAQAITPANVGERVWVRIERQTLTRLPATGTILFTVHTYQSPLVVVARLPERAQQLSRYLATVPPEMLHYKGMDRFIGPVLGYLAERAGADVENQPTQMGHEASDILDVRVRL